MSNASNQRTLFQSWGASLSQNKVVQPKNDAKKAAGRRKTTDYNTGKVRAPLPPRNPLWTEIGQGSTSTSEGRFEPEEDDDDDLMLVAVYEAEKTLQVEKSCQHDDPAGAENVSLSPLSPPSSAGRTYPDLPGFDSSSAKVWIYPTNYPIRDYQLKMSEAALFQNTLVCLPTGLGKTFIASVVLYNFYRWYPAGKIVFMAPTKPLVAQQIEACYKVMGIPQAHMAELTGSTAARQRQEVWRSRRVFFLTPQVMVNDLSRDTCPALQVKCVVIDEAHKALGNHAYCQVIRQLGSQTLQFRVLALSATPGGDTKAVQSVISNLLISHVELRSEESPDIQAHSHQRSVVKMVVPLGDVLAAHQARYLQVLEKFMSRLVQNRVMMHKDLRTLSKYQIILARDQFRKNPPPYIKGPQQGMLEGDFAICISLYHGYELLMQMGLRSLFFYVQGIMDGSREMSRAKNELQRTPAFMDLYHEMEAMFVKPPAGPDEPFVYSHPKLEKLEEVVLHHFRLCAESAADPGGSGLQEVSTRVMIFSSFRESVQEIAAMLDRHAPLIRVMTFMGQASAGKGVKGFTQKEQLEVVHRFRQGGFNTLVSTCVGEEGLDIGEVDLIVCFDAQKNPIRLVQRMGRTGRKREGRIVVILSEGREERTYNQSQSNKRSVFRSIVGNKSGFHMYPNSPRMLPEGVNPTLHKMHITCGQFDHRDSSSRRSARGRRSHSAGRASLIHPQNLNLQESATSDGFLSSAEFSLWASSMKLQDDEAHPALKPSHFLTLPHDRPPQEDPVRSGPPSRQLSLCEWRHWQHKTFPTHVVDHSVRCQHFIKVMELVNAMREEEEGECRYERELRPHLSAAAAAAPAAKKKAPRGSSKTSSDHLRAPRFVDEEADEPEPPADDVAARALESERPRAVGEDDSGAVVEVEEEAAVTETDDGGERTPGDAELQDVLYLPSWGSAPPPSSEKPRPGAEERLRAILANVAELLSTSPPPLAAESDTVTANQTLPPSPRGAGGSSPQFRVSFTLDMDDEEDEEEEGRDRTARGPPSPTWDEVFGDGDDEGAEGADDLEQGGTERGDPAGVEVDQSMDLFGDDEAFLEMTIPEIPTPEDAIPPRTPTPLSPSAHGSLDLFSVNFDLGYSLEDSDDSEVEEVRGVEGGTTPCGSPSLQPQEEVDPPWSSPVVPSSSTPQSSFRRPTRPPEPSTPHSLSAHRRGERSPPTASPLSRHVGTSSSLLVSLGTRGTLRTPPHSGSSVTRKRRRSPIAQGTSVTPSALRPADTDSEDEVVPHRRRFQNKARRLLSPETTRFSSDVDSPVVVRKKRATALHSSGETEAETLSDDDFQDDTGLKRTTRPERVRAEKTKHVAGRRWRQFLDEEAELSEDGGAEVLSDEEDGDDQDHSLRGFVVDNTHVSQGLNDSEMQGVYLKSVRSPAVGGRFKMSYRDHQDVNVFSQVPEADEEYAEDSFVVGSEADEPEEEGADDDVVELMPEDSYVDGRRQYATRRRVFLHRARAPSSAAARKDAGRGKRGRVIRVSDSSEEETDHVRTERGDPGAPPPPSKPQHSQKGPPSSSSSSSIASKLSLLCGGSVSEDQRRCRQRTEDQHRLSEQLDFMESESLLSAKKPPQVPAAPPSVPPRSLGESPASSSSSSGSVCILADSRCLSTGVELMSSLRQRHAATVHVCSLDGGYFIVSNRMAVERHGQSDLGSMHHRRRLAETVHRLQTSFERVCLIVETERTKPGETPRPFQRSRCYDSTLAALVQTGVRLLWSSGAEESAGLLADLARLEQRKGQGLSAPLEVKGHHGQQTLQFYLSLPSVNYAHALNMSCNFSSVSQLINSSIEAIQKGGCMSRARAEEIYRFLRFSCDPLLMKTSKAGKSC